MNQNLHQIQKLGNLVEKLNQNKNNNKSKLTTTTMEISRIKLNIRGVEIQEEETLENHIEDGVQTGTHYIFIKDEYGNQISIEDGAIKYCKFGDKEIYLSEGNLEFIEDYKQENQ